MRGARAFRYLAGRIGPKAEGRRSLSDLRRERAIRVLVLAIFLDLLGFGIVLPLLPVQAKALAEAPGVLPSGIPIGVVVGLLLSSSSAMQVVTAPIWGRFSDRVGRRPVLMICLAASAALYGVLAWALVRQSLLLLFLARIGAGAIGAPVPTAHACIADLTTSEGRARGMGLIGAAFGLAFTLGPLLGFLALPAAGDVFHAGPVGLAAAFSTLALALAWLRLPESLDRSRAGASPRSTFRDLFAALSAPALGPLLGAGLLCALAFSGFEATLALLLQDERTGLGYGVRAIWLTFASVGCLSAAIQAGVVGRLSASVSTARLVLVGAALELAGFAALGGAASSRSAALLFCGLPVLVGGFALLTPSLNALVSGRSASGRQGETMGLAQGASALGRIGGPLVGLPLFVDAAPGSPYWLGAALVAAGALLVIRARE